MGITLAKKSAIVAKWLGIKHHCDAFNCEGFHGTSDLTNESGTAQIIQALWKQGFWVQPSAYDDDMDICYHGNGEVMRATFVCLDEYNNFNIALIDACYDLSRLTIRRTTQ